MKELILIKLGGSVITDKSMEFTVRPENIKRLGGEIKAALKVFSGAIVIGHGAGSFAHTPAKKYQTKKGLINSKSLMGMSIVEDAARQLNAIVIKEFIKENLPVFPFSPASFIISDTLISIKSYIDPLEHLLLTGGHPVIYGDVIMDKKQGCTIFSTEKILSIIAKKLIKNYKIRMIYVTDVDGVYDENGKTIPVITSKNFDQLKSSILGARNVDVTGGMLHKVEESLKLAKTIGIKTQIVNGTKAGGLMNAILGKGRLSSTLVKK
ncbi:MAG: isopentenyl phosphate kinase family protein [Candidatus Woesebacteria bacterium]|nr:MAG: isopentenyl phosphate kinase family protein [Candidatus Woesebacteria bacterium]